jgi:hypothetical protein
LRVEKKLNIDTTNEFDDDFLLVEKTAKKVTAKEFEAKNFRTE